MRSMRVRSRDSESFRKSAMGGGEWGGRERGEWEISEVLGFKGKTISYLP